MKVISQVMTAVSGLYQKKDSNGDYQNTEKTKTPFRFYFKMGFKTLCPQTDKYIKNCIENAQDDLLPASEVLMLSAEDSKKYNKYLAKHYVICK